MIWLAAGAFIITALTLWYVLRPLLRPVTMVELAQRDQLEQFRDRLLVQLNELDVEEGDRNIDPGVVSDERKRLEAELAKVLRELKPAKGKLKKKKTIVESRRGWIVTIVILALLLPLSAAGLYALSQQTTLAYLINPEAQTAETMPPMVLEMVARLENRLESQPDDGPGWFRLGRAYAVLGRLEVAHAAYARAYQLMPDDPQVIAEYAAFLYNGDPQNTSGQVMGLYARLLELEPDNTDALWFMGFAAYQKGAYQLALNHWGRLMNGLPAESREAEHLQLIIAKTREKLGKK